MMTSTEVGLFMGCGYLLMRGIVSVASKMIPSQPAPAVKAERNSKMKPAALIAASVAATQLEKSKNEAAEKAIACKQLAVYGSKDAVPELAQLLADEQLASWSLLF